MAADEESGQIPGQASSDLEIIFYRPGYPDHPVATPPISRPLPITTWERLAHQIGSATFTQRLSVQYVTNLLSGCSGETALEAASNLASRLSPDREQRALQGFLLLNLCTMLYISGRAPPETLDGIMRAITKSSKPKYLDTLKRGVRVANEIIVQWAERDNGDRLQQLDRATQAVLQGTIDLKALYRV